ncbi:hypothetical protein FOZ61_009867 [Perkinsus olseni]|uniref:Uncharacterized protein n=1 Tax=Perkinsus olseni TaxID=32597 RepID=A0A7J6KZ63_PEROL|nr:hypothetical protein FOZ61_009867 [Perkinsus olseni]
MAPPTPSVPGSLGEQRSQLMLRSAFADALPVSSGESPSKSASSPTKADRARSPVPPLKIPAAVAMEMYGQYSPLSGRRMLSPTTPLLQGNSAREMYSELFKRADEKIEEQAETIRKQQLQLDDANERLRRTSSAICPPLCLAERVAEECDEAHERLHIATDRIIELETINQVAVPLAVDVSLSFQSSSMTSSWCSSIEDTTEDIAPFWRAQRAKRLLHIASLWSRLIHQAVVSARRREALLVLRRPGEQESLHRDCSEASRVHAEMFTPVELPVVHGCKTYHYEGDITERLPVWLHHLATTPRRVHPEWPSSARTDQDERHAWTAATQRPPRLIDVRSSDPLVDLAGTCPPKKMTIRNMHTVVKNRQIRSRQRVSHRAH